MKQSSIQLLIVSLAYIITGCNNLNSNVPLPEDKSINPVTIPLHFSAPKKIKFSDTNVIEVSEKKLNFNALPEKVFDSSGFKPFSKEPDVAAFNWDSLPGASFNYDSLPSRPLKFETFALDPPKIIKAGPLAYKVNMGEAYFQISNVFGSGEATASFAMQDKEGFLWILTDKGLYRYDGENIALYINKQFSGFSYLEKNNKGQILISDLHNFYVLDTKNNNLRYISVQNLNGIYIGGFLTDDENRIWITTDSGVRIIDEKKNTIKYFTVLQGLSNDHGFRLMEDEEKNIWITTFGGLSIVNVSHGNIKYLNVAHGLHSDSLRNITEDAHKKIWATGRDGLSIIEKQPGKISRLSAKIIEGESNDSSIIKVINVINDNTGNIWLSYFDNKGNNDLKVIDPENNMIKKINLPVAPARFNNSAPSQRIFSLFQDRFGQIWLSMNNGFYALKKAGYTIKHAGTTDITSLAEDNSKNIWIANVYNGVEILNRSTGVVKLLNTKNGLSSDTMVDMKAINGKIYCMTHYGLDIIDPANETIEYISNNHSKVQFSEVVPDKHGRLWIMTRSFKDILVVEPEKNLSYHADLSLNIESHELREVKQDSRGDMWFTTEKGKVGFINKEGNTVQYLDNIDGAEVCFDAEGNTWIGKNGIYKVNAQKDSVTVFTSKQVLFSDQVFSLSSYNNRVYAGSNGGINIINPPSLLTGKKWLIQSFGKSYGINKLAYVYNSDAITSDGTFLWGDKGITFLKDTLTNVSKIPNTYITGIDVFNQPQYFSSNPGGYTVENDTLWSLNKDTFYLKGQSLNTASFSNINKLSWDSTTGAYNMPVNFRLPYNENYIQFHFSQADLGMQDTKWYRYILEGIDKKWSTNTTNTESQNYINLSPGAYTFKVSSLYNNTWSKPAEFRFTILPPWWKTWWAYVMYFLLFAIIVWSYSLFRSRSLQRQNKLLEQKVNHRTEQLNKSLEELKSTQSQLIQSEKMASLGELTAGIAHEIQNPLNFVNNFSEVNRELIEELKIEASAGNNIEVIAIANDISANEEKINHHGKRADAIVKGMLQHSRQTKGVKEPTNINALCDEYLRLSYHGLRAKDKDFNATIKTDFDSSLSSVEGKINIIPQDIGRVLLNLYNNAFYAVAEKKKLNIDRYDPIVSVTTKKSENHVTITVSDNGNGIPQNIVDKIFQPFFTTKPTGQGTGLGLSLSYDIIKAHNGSLKASSIKDEFTEFEINLPYS